MFKPKTRVTSSKVAESDRPLMKIPPSNEPKQRRMMETALALLLVALGLVIYHDRDFWFADSAAESQEADDSLAELTSAGAAPGGSMPGVTTATARVKSTPKSRIPLRAKGARNGAPDSRANSGSRANYIAPATPAASPAGDTTAAGPGFAVSTQRTVLPPLEVEVVAGDIHRTVRPGSSSVHVDLQPGPPAQGSLAQGSPAQEVDVPAAPAAPAASSDSAAGVTHNAAEQVQMSTDASAVVSSSVKPDYPLLARQMRVQGSVILQALIGRNGAIQDLQVLSGPPILAAAAQEAVRQWHFKPHYQGTESVETLAKITVNFTISTN